MLQKSRTLPGRPSDRVGAGDAATGRPMTDPGMAPERLAAVLPHLAHGLKRPLSAIVLSADILRGHGLPEDDVRQIAGGIVVSAREAVALVDDLVNLLRLETGQWVLSP